jgi:serine/threonine protein kinase
MKCCVTDLRKWINSHRSASDTEKINILQGAILGLANLHRYGCIHGDLKPGNILINNLGESLLGDLGFVAPAKYSKCNYTAASYREKDIKHDKGHDLFSLAIILIEMFGDWRHKRYPSTDDVRSRARTIKHKLIYQLVVLLVSTRREKRPTAAMVYYQLYNCAPKIKSITMYENSNVEYDVNISNWMRKCGEKFRIKEVELGINIIMDFLIRKKINIQLYQVYCASFLTILSSIYGYEPLFHDDHAEHACGYKYKLEEVHQVIKNMLSDYVLVSRLCILR